MKLKDLLKENSILIPRRSKEEEIKKMAPGVRGDINR